MPDIISPKGTDGIDNMYTAFLKTFFSLIIVLALLFIFLYYFQKYYKKGFISRSRSNKSLAMHDSISISSDKHISVISFKERYFLVGITEKSITLIAELDRIPEDLDENQD